MAFTQSWATTVTILHNYDHGDPLTAQRNQSKAWRFNDYRKMIKAMLLGATRNGAVALVGTAAAAATVTFSSTGAAVNDTVTVNGVAFTAKKHSATGTVTCASVANGDTVTVGGIVFTFKTTPTSTFDVLIGGSDTATAANLVAAVNSFSPTSGVSVTASNVAGVVTFRANATGTGGNATTLTSSNGGRLAVSGATLTGGATPGTNEFDQSGTLTQQAASLAAAVTASQTALVLNYVSGASAAAVATLSAVSKGLAGNMFTLAKSGTNLAVSGAAFTGGTQTTYTF